MTGWERAAPLIAKALKYQDEHDLDYVKREVEECRAQLWHGQQSIIVTRLVRRLDGLACVIWLASGRMGELVEEMLPDVEAWAKTRGCVKIVIVGRKGWVRKLKRQYTATHVVLERAI